MRKKLFFFGYKGPEKGVESDFRVHPKLEFEIDKDAEKKFIETFGDHTKRIEKDRILYELDGVMFFLDDVVKIEKGDVQTYLEKFIEIRSTDKEINDEKIKSLVSKLGLKMEDGIKTPYSKM
ncbi:MAG: hypothetical protein WCS86_00430 [Candidatus Paceibacterota bacterium]